MSENGSSSKKKETKEEKNLKPPLDKIIIDTLPPRSGTCVFHNVFYTVGRIDRRLIIPLF
jgi:hypothetical protein